ncbi:MAG: hypothetical protein WC798_01995 [Candidatus Paceibacterota bacterium]
MPPQDSDLAKRVIGCITSKRLTPRPRWVFTFKNYFFWILGALAITLGAFAFSAMLFQITFVDWSLSSVTHASFFAFFLAAAPFLWVSALALFIIVGQVNIRRTSHGYRYPIIAMTLGSMFLSVAFGGGFYMAGLGGDLDEAIGDHPPLYRSIVAQERSWWLAPEKGLLTGHVVEVASGTSSFVLRDLSGQSWEIDGNNLSDQVLSAVTSGEEVRIVGLPAPTSVSTMTSASVRVPTAATTTITTFHACFVLSRERDREKVSSPESYDESCENIRPYRHLRDLGKKNKKDEEEKKDAENSEDDEDDGEEDEEGGEDDGNDD